MRSRCPKIGVAARMMPRLQVVDLNPHLSCILCGGYFIDATTITECLHSFCRACIVRYLETSQYCPVCEVQVHKSKPLRSDKILQDIVYKLVPGLFHNEMKKRRELYASQPPEALNESRDAEDRGECLDEKFIYAPDEIFSLSVEYGKEVEKNESAAEDDFVPSRRFLRCPAALTIGHLKKFVRMKYGIPNTYEINLRYDQESLHDEYTLMDVAYIFLWRRSGPMRFFYKIVERPPKKAKSEHVFMEVDAQESEKETDTETKAEVGEVDCTPPAPHPAVPQKRASEKDATEHCPPVKDTGGYSTTEPVCQVLSSDSQLPKAAESVDPASKDEKKSLTVETNAETCEDSTIPDAIPKKESKSPFKFPPATSTSLTASESKPAVMTVAPLTKPSSSLPTTSSSSTSGTVTHGLYTGISIKKSPPNTLPPFTISAHLLPPRVPPLKLSPPRFSKLETCLRELSSSSKKSSTSRKSKSSRDKLELKVAQLKSGKCVAPIVISVPPEAKLDSRKDLPVRDHHQSSKRPEDAASAKNPVEPPHPFVPLAPTLPTPSVVAEKQEEDNKMDLDSEDLFEGPLVIAEPDIPPKEDSNSSRDALPPREESAAKPPPDDSEDEEIDVVDDGEVDSGRGSDVSSRTRSLCGDEDPLGSPDSGVVLPKTPDAERPQHSLPNRGNFLKSQTDMTVKNGVEAFGGALDLSTCGSRKRGRDGSEDGPVFHRAKQVANPAVLDKSRQTTTPCVSPDHSPFKVLAPEISHLYKGGKHHHESRTSGGGSFKCRGNNLAVINPNPNGQIPKLVIRNLGPNRAGHERFHHHHHHHHHNHHHQRM